MKEYHVTDLMLFKHCPAKYYWQVEQRRRKEWSGVARPVGSAVHVGLEALYKGLDLPQATNMALEAYKERTPPGVREGLEAKDLAEVVAGEVQVARCMQHYIFSPLDFKEVIEIEKVHKVPLGEGRLVVGTIDRLVKTNGATYIHDVKTTGIAIEKATRLQKLRMQYPAYVWLLRQEGVHVNGVIVELIQKPKLYRRKDGTFSSSQPLYHRELVPITQLELDRWETWVHEVVERIEEGRNVYLDDKGANHADSLNTEACFSYMQLCSYYELCLTPKRAQRLAEENFVQLERGER